MLVIFGLCLILSLLRRASRTYSFDLQRPTPVDRSGKPDGTFESIYLDDLDQLSPDYLAHPPLTNGMSTEPQGWDFDGENGTTTHPQDQGGIMESGGRSLSQFSVAEITSAAFKQEIIHHPPLYHDDAHPSCPSSLSAEEQPTPNGMETSATSKSYPDPACETSPQLSGAEHLNENNNNLSVCSGDPFVEISLNDPTWCRQLLQPTEAPSSFSSSSPQHLY
ncbi:uncharacterized protein [Antennarius striatus]|uniref:uncharacterized protein n=1 Tax=Antennarius striatus TaxID=241820 RepID=UPI0035B23E3F